MSSLRHAAELLTTSASVHGAGRVAALLGFTEPIALDSQARERFGIAADVRRAFVGESKGLLRCCTVVAASDQDARPVAARCAARIAARAPHALWLVIVVQPATRTFIVAVPPLGASVGVAALVVDARRVRDSDAETIAAMADAASPADAMTHHRWREILGRDALTRRFYRELESAVGELASSARGRAPEHARREIALLCTSRLLFLAFLEAKGWLDGDREFLRHQFDARCASGGSAHRRLLEPLFFGTLNTPVSRRAAFARRLGRVPFLNGGLFGRTVVERRWRDTELTDGAIGRVICELLGRYRVTAREESVSWSEAAIDPEMLGRAFESLMATDERRRSGAFYTPLPLIERLTSCAIDEWLAGCRVSPSIRARVLSREPLSGRDRDQVLAHVAGVRVLDPACGSGAFLVHALERLAEIRAAAGDRRPTSVLRRETLTRSIFGVDVNPMAVWLCELRLWLSVVIDAAEHDGMNIAPLPNLDHNIRVGDSLAGHGFEQPMLRPAAGLSSLRRRYARATGVRKRDLARALDGEERRLAVAAAMHEHAGLTARRRDLLLAVRGRDLFLHRIVPTTAQRAELEELRNAAREARRRATLLRAGGALPFSFHTHFADTAAAGGFDLIVGNPPWVRLHRIAPADRAGLARRFESWKHAAWVTGARDAGAGRGFSSQVDLAALFVERATQLARPGGAISLLVPAKLWTSLSAGGIRRVLLDGCRVRALEDWSESPTAFDAVVYPSLLLAARGAPEPQTTAPMRGTIHRPGQSLSWTCAATELALDDSPGAPWLIVPPEVRNAFNLLDQRGTHLARSTFGRPLLGVKTGCNDAFVVQPRPGWHDLPKADDSCVIRGGDLEDNIEIRLLRPLLRGEDVCAWATPRPGRALIWTHDVRGAPLERLPPMAAEWMARWKQQLQARSDAARGGRYWTLFRTEAADSSRPRVVWSDISRVPRATVVAAGDPTVPLNSCYVCVARSTDDALALAALLNSAPVAAWLCALAEPARGGYRRFLGWTLSRLPVPRDWDRAVSILAPIARDACAGRAPDPHTLAVAVARAYRLRLASLEPLLTWCLR